MLLKLGSSLQRSRKPPQTANDCFARQRRVGEELAVGATTPPSRAARRLWQQHVHQLDIKVVEDHSMVQQTTAHSPLGVSGELPIVDGEIGRPDSDAIDSQNASQPAKQPGVAAFHIGQQGTPIERKDQGEVQAAGTDHHCATGGLPVQHRNSPVGADPNANPFFGVAVPGQYHGKPFRFPDKQPFTGVDRAACFILELLVRISGRRFGRCCRLLAPQRLDFQPQPPLGRNRSVVLDLHGQRLTTRPCRLTTTGVRRLDTHPRRAAASVPGTIRIHGANT